MSFIGGGGGGFEAARQSTSRGFVFFPSLDTRQEINHLNRTEILRKVRWLYNNDGFTRRVVNGLARMIGYCVPKPQTPDREWNALAKRVALDIAKSRNRFDRSGKYNFFSYQLNLNRLGQKDGDSLTVPTLSDTGSTQIMCYESHQIGDDIRSRVHRRSASRTQQWFDGVRTDRHKKHLAYRILHPDNPDKSKVVPAGSAHLFARYERPGQPRGISACAHLVNPALDVREISNDMGTGMKARNLIGFYLAAKDPEMPLPSAKGIQNSLKKWQAKNSGTAVEENEEQLSYEEIFTGSNLFKAENYEPKVLESAQPHENEIAFLDWKIRMMSLGFDIAPELIWEIGNLNGNTQRWLAEDAQEVLSILRVETLIPFCQWWWFEAIGNAIATKQLREPKIPKDLQPHVGWWTCDWIPPRSKTIDRGREGKLRIEERRALLKTFDTLYSEEQKDWTEETDQWLHEIDHLEKRMKELGWPDSRIEIVLANLLAPPPGTSLLDMSESAGDDDDDLAVPDDEVEEEFDKAA